VGVSWADEIGPGERGALAAGQGDSICIEHWILLRLVELRFVSGVAGRRLWTLRPIGIGTRTQICRSEGRINQGENGKGVIEANEPSLRWSPSGDCEGYLQIVARG
jgi:hypothetical protein